MCQNCPLQGMPDMEFYLAATDYPAQSQGKACIKRAIQQEGSAWGCDLACLGTKSMHLNEGTVPAEGIVTGPVNAIRRARKTNCWCCQRILHVLTTEGQT